MSTRDPEAVRRVSKRADGEAQNPVKGDMVAEVMQARSRPGDGRRPVWERLYRSIEGRWCIPTG